MQNILAEVGEIILGHTFRGAIVDTPNGNYYVLQAKNIRGEGTLEAKDLTATFLDGTKMKALARDRDVVLSNRGTFRAAVFKDARQNVLAASSIYLIRIRDHAQCLPEYLAIFLNSHEGQNLLEGMNRGTLIKSLPKKSLLGLSVPLPALHVQKTVIDIQKNYAARADLYERKLRLEEQIANQTIASLISQ